MSELQERLQAAMGDTFRIERELEGGGMSRLFIAVEASLNRRVVIKLLPPEFANEVSAARFKKEVEVAAQLQHPHILPVLTAGARDGLLYYIMPYVHGESLRHRIMREGKLPVADAMRILLEIADALATAHAAGIVHRDIKPENILLEGKHAVLADFGIARAIVQSRTGGALTSTGSSVGTPGYMSPEQFSGDAIDASTDVYALAVVGYEMLAGHQPFTGGTAQALLKAHLTATPRPLHDVRPEVSRRVSDALARAMAKTPGERFTSASEFAEAIEPSARRPSRPGMAALRTPLVMRVAVTVGVVALAVVAFLAWNRGRVSPEAAARIATLADSGKMDEIAVELAGASLTDRRLKGSAARFIGKQAIVISDPKTLLSLTRATPFDTTFSSRSPAWQGNPSRDSVSLIAGEYVLRAPLSDVDTLILLLNVQPGANSAVVIQLPPADSSAALMRIVSSGPSPTGSVVEAFLMDRSEISNAEFQRFIAGGGYRAQALWPATMTVGGASLTRTEALARFVDRSGLPGPRFWTSGRFADGQVDHPVVGITWYEAAAYAAWAGKALPTAAQWWRAALGEGTAIFPWGRDGANIDVRANLDGTATKGRGTMPLGMSPFGVEHMAGNAREWLADSTRGGDRRIVVGGSWQDPSYMFERSHAEAFSPGFSNDAIGFRLVRPLLRR